MDECLRPDRARNANHTVFSAWRTNVHTHEIWKYDLLRITNRSQISVLNALSGSYDAIVMLAARCGVVDGICS